MRGAKRDRNGAEIAPNVRFGVTASPGTNDRDENTAPRAGDNSGARWARSLAENSAAAPLRRSVARPSRSTADPDGRTASRRFRAPLIDDHGFRGSHGRDPAPPGRSTSRGAGSSASRQLLGYASDPPRADASTAAATCVSPALPYRGTLLSAETTRIASAFGSSARDPNALAHRPPVSRLHPSSRTRNPAGPVVYGAVTA